MQNIKIEVFATNRLMATVDSLPCELLTDILCMAAYDDTCTYVCAQLCCIQWYAAMPKRAHDAHTDGFMDCAVINGDIKMLEWGIAHGCRVRRYHACDAIAQGYLDVIRWLHEHSPIRWRDVHTDAISADNVRILDLLHDLGVTREITAGDLDYAIDLCSAEIAEWCWRELGSGVRLSLTCDDMITKCGRLIADGYDDMLRWMLAKYAARASDDLERRLTLHLVCAAIRHRNACALDALRPYCDDFENMVATASAGYGCAEWACEQLAG